MDNYFYCSFIVDEIHVRVGGRDLMEKNVFDDIAFDFDFLFPIPYYFEFCFMFIANTILV